MSALLDTEKVRKALLSDPAFSAGLPEPAQAAFGELIEALPAVLETLLDKKVTLSSFMESKLAIVEHSLDSGFVEKMFKSVPEEMMPFPAETMAGMMTEQLARLRMPFMEMIHNTRDFLKAYGVTERQMLANAQGGRFSAQTLAAYDAGTLTIRSLLETQPAALLLNGEG
ncbi:MAG TPA: hypothetical protein VJ694_03050 [Patescibacteria group bacterium]|nr:hypothetical protein [Patescibacteria group bacterium]